MILLDTSGTLAALFPDQRRHRECAAALRASSGPRILSPFVLAELDYLIAKLSGFAARLAFIDEVERGVYELADFSATDLGEVRGVMSGFRDLDVGLADASIVVLSRRHRSLDLLSLDERHFRMLRGVEDRPFRMLPADA